MARKKSDKPALPPVEDEEQRAKLIQDAKTEHDQLLTRLANQRELTKAINKQVTDLFRRLKSQLGINRGVIEEHFAKVNIEDDILRAQHLAWMRELNRALPIGEQTELFPEDEDAAAAGETGEMAAGVVHEPGTNGIGNTGGLTYEDGRQAGLAGKPAADNPFSKRLKAHHTWEAGRMAGQAERAHEMDAETGSAEPDERRSGQAPRSKRRSVADEAPAGTA